MKSGWVYLWIAFAACAAQAQVYKWVDEDGRTQYTQKPPPGKKSQEVTLHTAPPSGKPETSAPGTKPAPSSAAAKPEQTASGAKPDPSAADKGAKGKPKPQYEQGKAADDRNPDAIRLSGDWQTGLGQPVQVGFSAQGNANPILVRQTWRAAGASAIGTGTKYIITGLDGRGILTAQEIPQGAEAQLPNNISYQFQGDVLLLIVNAGPFTGRHRLTRTPPPK